MHPATVVAVFLLSGSAHVDVAPFPASDHPVEIRVTLSPGARPGHVSLRLDSNGTSCDLDAARSADDVLGAEIVVPEGWTPAAPVQGTVVSRGSGSRQGSPR